MPDSPQVVALANAIGIAEGFGKKGAIPTVTNNPGDLKNGSVGKGTTPNGITIYPTIDAGRAALIHQINVISNGKSEHYNTNMTITEMGNIYANGDPNWATNVSNNLGVPASTKIGDVIGGSIPVKNPGYANPDGSGQAVAGDGMSIDQGRAPTDFVALQNNDISTATYDSLFPDTVIATGLDETPWYDDPGLLIGNQPIRDAVQPVVFQVFLKNKNGFYLSDSSQVPIDIQLNASMKGYSIASKHAFHEQRTRTAFHITMWGMNADLIEGSCTTGVFMNQFGLTDFFSVADVNEDLKRLVTSGTIFKDVPTASVPNGDVVILPSQELSEFDAIIARTATKNPQAAFRVAAQDAFVEFLSLFKMNGTVWFRNNDYREGGLAGKDQQAPGAWSSQLGASSNQANARNNDVMTRGYVIMKFRSNTYQGYFKSLSWTMDAKNPFQWNFNFTFQVERTLNMMYFPQ
jgi:hypothetical protein